MTQKGIRISREGLATIRKLLMDGKSADLHGFCKVFLDKAGRECVNMENGFRVSIGKKPRRSRRYRERMVE